MPEKNLALQYLTPSDPSIARALYREGVENLKRIYVCANHFLPEDIETKYSIAQPDVSLLEVERANPLLRKDAVPRFLPAAPLT